TRSNFGAPRRPAILRKRFNDHPRSDRGNVPAVAGVSENQTIGRPHRAFQFFSSSKARIDLTCQTRCLSLARRRELPARFAKNWPETGPISLSRGATLKNW